MSQQFLIGILTVTIPAIVTIAGIIIKKQSDDLRVMREQLAGKKYSAYADAVKMFYSLLVDSKTGRTIKNDTAFKKMAEMKRDIFMYGSDKVFLTFNKWLLTVNSDDSKYQLSMFLDFALEMRKDLCNNKTKLTKRDILINLTQSEEEAGKLI